MRQTSGSAGITRFGVFEVDTVTGELRKQGLRIRLQEQPFQVLALLLTRPGELVTREELRLKLWPAGTFVDFEHSLNKAINKLREALGDDSDSPRYIETLPRRGYRFIVPISSDKQPEDTIGFPDIKATPPTSGVIGNPHRIQWMKQFLILLLGVFVLIAAVLLYEQAHNQTKPATVMHAAAPNHSVAVLPIMNLSGDASQNYFADGMTDELITVLSQISALRVISRTSVMHYKQTTKTLPQIGRELGVATVLEGSVQKSGNQVLINLRLIDAATEDDLWSETYKRTLKNIFSVEDEAATKVAEALRATLTQAESSRISVIPTQNPQAYDLFLQGEYYLHRADSSGLNSDETAAIKYYTQATEQDPQFALAYARLAAAQISLGTNTIDSKQMKLLTSQAKLSIDRALALSPNLAEAHLAQGYYQDYVLLDLDAALASFQTALALKPQDPNVMIAIGRIYQHRGQMDKAADYLKKVVDLDPRNIPSYEALAVVYEWMREYPQAESLLRRALAIDPESTRSLVLLATSVLRRTGDADSTLAVLDSTPANAQNDSSILGSRIYLMYLKRDYAVAEQLVMREEKIDLKMFLPGDLNQDLGEFAWKKGNRVTAREYFLQSAAETEAALKHNPDDVNLHELLGFDYARLGRSRDALQQGRLCIKIADRNPNFDTTVDTLLSMAVIQAQLGQVSEAVANLDRLLAMPSGLEVSTPMLKLEPIWDSIRNDPRFLTLLKKYGNSGKTELATRGG